MTFQDNFTPTRVSRAQKIKHLNSKKKKEKTKMQYLGHKCDFFFSFLVQF